MCVCVCVCVFMISNAKTRYATNVANTGADILLQILTPKLYRPIKPVCITRLLALLVQAN